MSDRSPEERYSENSRSSSEESSMHDYASQNESSDYDTENEDSDMEQHSHEHDYSTSDNNDDSNDDISNTNSEVVFFSDNSSNSSNNSRNNINSNNVISRNGRENDRIIESDLYLSSSTEVGNENASEGESSSSSTSSNEENYIFMSTVNVSLVKELMKQVLKVSALLKQRREAFPSFVRIAVNSTRASLEEFERQQVNSTNDAASATKTEPKNTLATSVESTRNEEPGNPNENNANSYELKNGTSRENSVCTHERELYKKYTLIADEWNDLLTYHNFLWRRLLFLLQSEYNNCADAYALSLKLEDRMPFESMAHTIHHNTKFCDYLGEVMEISFNNLKPSIDNEHLEEHEKSILNELWEMYIDAMTQTQLIATHFAVLVVEGTHESFLDPFAVQDLCKVIKTEPIRRKRLVSLSLLFSMLDQDDMAIAEVLSENIPRVLLQRFRHLVHRIFGKKGIECPNESQAVENSRKMSVSANKVNCDSISCISNDHNTKTNYTDLRSSTNNVFPCAPNNIINDQRVSNRLELEANTNLSATHSLQSLRVCPNACPWLEHSMLVPTLGLNVEEGMVRQNSKERCPHQIRRYSPALVSCIPSPLSEASTSPTFPPASLPSMPCNIFDNEANSDIKKRKRSLEKEESTTAKVSRVDGSMHSTEHNTIESELPVEPHLEQNWAREHDKQMSLTIGDYVSPGPDWQWSTQASVTDYGVVVGIAIPDQVVVHWKPLPTASSSEHEYSKNRLFSYTYEVNGVKEVLPWRALLSARADSLEPTTLIRLELMLSCAIIGVLCQQRDTVLPSLQFESIDAALHILDSLHLCELYKKVHLQSANCIATGTVRTNSAIVKEGVVIAEEQDRQEETNNIAQEQVESIPGIASVAAAKAEKEEELPNTVEQNEQVMSSERQLYREHRELFARTGWVLNALLSHKKLALLFLERDGLRRIINVMSGPMETSTSYGCCVMLTHLARHTIFEELLRLHGEYFQPIMSFIWSQWCTNNNTDVKNSAGVFVFYAISFPCVLAFYDAHGGSEEMSKTLEELIKASQERFDVVDASIQLVSLKCLNMYLVSTIMLSSKVLFRKHRVLSVLARQEPTSSLPRDPSFIDAVLSILLTPSVVLQDITADNVRSLLTKQRLPTVAKLLDNAVHLLLILCSSFYFMQNRWELLTASLQGLCVLTVLPFARLTIAELAGRDSGIAGLMLIVGELITAYQNNSMTRVSHLLPCATTALQIIIHLSILPFDKDDESAVNVFLNVCTAIRASGGVRTLLDVLRLRLEDASMSAKLSFFPVLARAVQVMVTLRHHGDTITLFSNLGVHRIAQELLMQYKDVQREYVSLIGRRKIHIDLDPTGRFMENVKSLASLSGHETSLLQSEQISNTNAAEMEHKEILIQNALIEYDKHSLLELIAQYLQENNMKEAANAIRNHDSAFLTSQRRHSTSSSTTIMDGQVNKKGSANDTTLDDIVKVYLRHQHEKNSQLIETLPTFNLTQKHVFTIAPPSSWSPLISWNSRSMLDRQLIRNAGQATSFHRMRSNETCLEYRHPVFLFDITGGEEGLRGESVAFCDDGDTVIIGTSEGAVALFDTFPEETMDEKLLEQHLIFENETVSDIVCSDDNHLLAALNEWNKVKILPRNSLPVVLHELDNCKAVRFSHDSSRLLVTKPHQSTCILYDLSTAAVLNEFTDSIWLGENFNNTAVFNPSSQLILSDAVIWDVRCSDKPIMRFDRIANAFANIFHPYCDHVLIDEKVWDMRMVQIVNTIPAFRRTCSFHIPRTAEIIYGFHEPTTWETAAIPVVSAVESYTYETIFSEEIRPAFRHFVIDPSSRYCAAVLEQDAQSVIRLFSTSSGPFPEHAVFAAPNAERDEAHSELDHESRNGDEGDDEDDDDEEIEEWSEDTDFFSTSDESDEEDGNSSEGGRNYMRHSSANGEALSDDDSIDNSDSNSNTHVIYFEETIENDEHVLFNNPFN